uniref:Uncharacterized protein n=1 Tax=Nelumbo nucifera TaxID=4432 RepID=A0A822YXA8_NELNU|nr:TPA_asm: hypothetical protein HUJ06_013026 [Nelumbo nucifera]
MERLQVRFESHNSDEGKKWSVIARGNWSQQKYAHSGGTKSNARLRHEMMQETGDGAQPSKGVVWIKTHRRKDGALVDAESRRAMEQLENLASQRATTSGGSSVPNDDDFGQIFGEERHGYARTYVLSVTPSTLSMSCRNRASESTSTRGGCGHEDRDERLRWIEDNLERVTRACSDVQYRVGRVISVLPQNLQDILNDDRDLPSRGAKVPD